MIIDPPRREGLRVLVVDDDVVDRSAIRRALARQCAGIDITETVDVASAVAARAERAFDCGIVDYSLPDGTAFDLIRRLESSVRGTLPVVILTGFDNDALALVALKRGAQDYLTKGELGGRTLIRAIRYAIERAKVNDLQQRLLHADRLISIGQLAAGVAHEVNNPASYVLGNLELLEDGLHTLQATLAELAPPGESTALGEREREIRATLAECVTSVETGLLGMDRIRSVTEGLRNFARIEREEIEEVELLAMLESTCRFVHTEIRHRAQLVMDVRGLPTVAAHGGRLSQVFTNLLMNAAHAIGPGDSGRNQIRIVGRVEDGGIRLSVEDTGVGMAPETLERALQPFFTTKARGQGTGLGLSLCVDIVRKHGGELRIQSEVGVGTRVDVLLPFDTGLGLPPTAAETDVAAPAAGSRSRVLIVDDEVALGRTFALMLAPHHDVTFAAGGREGLAILSGDQPFDIILCDLMMPDVDGIAIYQYLQRERPALSERLVFCTGGVFIPEIQDFLLGVSNLCLHKPITRHRLLEAITRVTRGQ